MKTKFKHRDKWDWIAVLCLGLYLYAILTLFGIG